MTAVLNEHQQWVTNGGIPIVNGRVYFGVVNQDPKANPITIYADRLLTVVLANPQPTDSNGRTINKVWVDGQYSLKLENSSGSQLYQQLDFGSDFVGGIISLKNIQGANTIVSNAIPFLTSLVDGQLFELTLAQTNTGDVTLKIDSQVTKPVLKNHTEQIAAGEFEATQKSVVIYNGTDDVFESVNQNTKDLAAQVATNTANLVTGPVLAVDDQITVFDGTTGKLIKDGGQTIAGVIAAAELTTNTIIFTSNDTYNKPAGLVFLTGLIVGGGGGGASAGSAGSAGDTTSFGSLITHSGGGGGTVLGATGSAGSASPTTEFCFHGSSDGRYFDSVNFGSGGGGSGGGGSGGNAIGGFFHIVETEIASSEPIIVGLGGLPGGASDVGKPGKISIIEYING